MTDSSSALRLSFFQIDDDTRTMLREVQPIAAAALPEILDRFYEIIGQYSDTARFFRDAAHRRHAKEHQLRHWDLILSGRYDEDYFRSSQIIGKTHQRIGLEPRWYIGGYSYLVSELLRTIEDKITLPKYGRGLEAQRQRKGRLLAAVSKAALLDMDLAISVYLDANMEAKKETIDKLGHSFQTIVDSVSSASTELESTAQSLSRTADQSVNLTGVVTEASDDASRNVQSVASATEELASSVGEISRQVQQSNQVAAMAVQQASQANERIGALSEAASRIGAVIKLISDVAEQTNLLALNATIEAARAGAAGRGFAVVAQEVKALAAQTAKATEDIGAQIVGMQAATNDAVGSIRSVTGTIDQISQFTSAIAAAIEEQGVATQEIAQNIQRAASGTSQVNGTIREVNRGAAETGTASEQVLAAAKQLAHDATRLRQEIDNFLTSIRAAA